MMQSATREPTDGEDAPRRFQLVRQPRLREAVVQQLIDEIAHGRISPGAKLPTENELIREFGVSRTVVREALKVLEEKGLIEVQHGRGAIVQSRDQWNVLDPDILAADIEGPDAGRLFDELTQMRIAIECEMAEQAARRATSEQLAAMEQVVQRMRGLVDAPDAYLEDDIAFHNLIIQAAGNRVARAIMDSIHVPLKQSRRLTNRIPGGIEKAQEFHEALLAQLRQRHPEGARETMRAHLQWHTRAWRQVLLDDEVKLVAAN